MLKFFRRQRPINESDVQELYDKFELPNPISHGVPRNLHRLAVDSLLGLVAIITKQGYVELYNKNGSKKVLLKKLGSPCTFFDFVEGEHLLLVICAANTSSGLPESYHLLDTNGISPCSTTCRPSNLSQAKCFTLTRLPNSQNQSIVTGNSNGCIFVAEVNRDQLEFTKFASIPKLLPDLSFDKFNDFSSIRASSKFIFCSFRNSFIVILCLKSRRVLKTIDMPFKFTVNTINESLNLALFVSTEVQISISLEDLSTTTSKVVANSFGRTSFYEILTLARTGKPIVIYSSGIPDSIIRRSGSLTLCSEEETRIFSLASDLLDVRIVYERKINNRERRATAIILLCEHEVIALDLLDENFRCLPLNFLQCVDSSAVTCIRLETVNNPHFFHQYNDEQYSERQSLFDDALHKTDKGPKSLIFTGHQNGDIFVWDMTSGSQRLLQIYKTTNYLRAGTDEYADESLEADENQVEDDDSFEIEQTDYEIVQQNSVSTSSIEWIQSPSKLWKESKSKKLIEIGLYEDRCEDDKLAVESFYYCDQLDLLACGLYGGFVLVLSTSDENNSTSRISANELKFVNVKLADIDQSFLSQESIKIQTSSLWDTTLFKPKPNILCILPSTPVRTLNISDVTGFVAVGCSTGIVVFDPSGGKIIFSKNFLNHHGVQTVLAIEKPLNRLKTMKQTVRKTFRRKSLRMSRAGNQRPIERQVEFRDTKQPTNSGIRCVRFHENIDERSFLFAGTSNAVIYMFEFETSDSCYLAKEIRLSHTAPIVDINFIRLDNQTKMFVFTEEQIRCFVVENLRSTRFSYKLTAKCGLRIKQANVVSSLDGNHLNYLNVICNDGSLIAMSSTDQRIHKSQQIMAADDAIGIRLSAIGNRGDIVSIGQSGSFLTYFATTNH